MPEPDGTVYRYPAEAMTYTARILFGAACAWLRNVESRVNALLGPWLCPRRY